MSETDQLPDAHTLWDYVAPMLASIGCMHVGAPARVAQIVGRLARQGCTGDIIAWTVTHDRRVTLSARSTTPSGEPRYASVDIGWQNDPRFGRP